MPTLPHTAAALRCLYAAWYADAADRMPARDRDWLALHLADRGWCPTLQVPSPIRPAFLAWAREHGLEALLEQIREKE